MQNQLFSTVPEQNLLGLYDAEAPSYKEIAHFLKFDRQDLSRATGLPVNSVRDDGRMPDALKARLSEISVVCEHVASFFDGDVAKTAQWFSLPNPMLGNISPRDMIRFGRFKKLMTFILAAISTNKPAGAK